MFFSQFHMDSIRGAGIHNKYLRVELSIPYGFYVAKLVYWRDDPGIRLSIPYGFYRAPSTAREYRRVVDSQFHMDSIVPDMRWW